MQRSREAEKQPRSERLRLSLRVNPSIRSYLKKKSEKKNKLYTVHDIIRSWSPDRGIDRVAFSRLRTKGKYAIWAKDY